MQGEIKAKLRRGAALAAVLLLGLPAFATEGRDSGRDRRVPPGVPVNGHSNQGGGPVGDESVSHSNQGRRDPGWRTPGLGDVVREFPGWPGEDGVGTEEVSGGGFGGPFGGPDLGSMDFEITDLAVAPDPELLGQGTRLHADPLNMSSVNSFGIDVGSSSVSGAMRLPGDGPLSAVPGPGSLPLLLLAASLAHRRRRRSKAT